MTVTICNGKGGSGKTTVAVLLVLALRQRGQTAELVDRDPQGTAWRWLETVAEPSAASAPPNGSRRFRIVDTPPNLGSAQLTQSLQEADAVVLVSSVSPADMWATRDSVAHVGAHVRTGVPVRLLFNQVQRRTVLGRDLARLADRIGVPPLSSSLSRRQAYQHAALMGWEMLDRAARDEIDALATEIVHLIPAPDEEKSQPA